MVYHQAYEKFKKVKKKKPLREPSRVKKCPSIIGKIYGLGLLCKKCCNGSDPLLDDLLKKVLLNNKLRKLKNHLLNYLMTLQKNDSQN